MVEQISLKDYEELELQPWHGETIIAENVDYKDFLVRFEGQRTEWVMGYVIRTEMTNNPAHNRLLHFLSYLFTTLMLNRRIAGEVLLAGISMFVDKDKPAREPDLMIVLGEKRKRITKQYLDGAADLCVEIVSPESIERDRGKKFKEYEAAGVKEYWLVDLLRRELAVYALDDNGHYHRIELNAEGKVASKLLPDFVIDPKIMWRDELPQGDELLALVQSML